MTTSIEWTDLTSNEVAGCTAVDAGCRNCYAAGTALLRPQFFDGLARRETRPRPASFDSPVGTGRPIWTGKILERPAQVERLLRTRKPKRVFHCSMGDLFHPDVPDETLDHAFAVMALTPWLLHQVLTRQVERMADYLSARGILQALSVPVLLLKNRFPKVPSAGVLQTWPLSNVVAMTSVIDQATADERLPHLLRCPARWRSVSYEPALGPVDFREIVWPDTGCCVDTLERPGNIDQIIAGGESGPRARPPHPEWFRNTRNDCEESGVAFFFKQWGEWKESPPYDRNVTRGAAHMPQPTKSLRYVSQRGHVVACRRDGMRQGEPYRMMDRVGKKPAGRALDGRTHDGEPWEWRDGAWRAKP